MRPPLVCASALTTIPSTFTCRGRVRANRTQSAMSSAVRARLLVDRFRLLLVALEPDERAGAAGEAGARSVIRIGWPSRSSSAALNDRHRRLTAVDGGVLVRLLAGDRIHVDDVSAVADAGRQRRVIRISPRTFARSSTPVLPESPKG
jgi:hypothetical protein